MGLLYGENLVILASTVFDRSICVSVTDGRTDGQSHICAIAYNAVARKNRISIAAFRNIMGATCYLATIAKYWSLLWGSTVRYPSNSLASCFAWQSALYMCYHALKTAWLWYLPYPFLSFPSLFLVVAYRKNVWTYLIDQYFKRRVFSQGCALWAEKI